MNRNLSERADNFARKLARENFYEWEVQRDWDALRDRLDAWTGGELNCQPLDILTDMVAHRLEVMS